MNGNMKNAEANDKAAAAGEQGAHVAPEKASPKKRASQKKGAPKAKKSAKAPAHKKEAKAPRRARAQKGATDDRVNKKAEVVALMRRAKGATVDEIIAVTSWQRHTVRGFISLLGSKGALKIESEKNAAGERSYRIAK
jgi:hypothetical protein